MKEVMSREEDSLPRTMIRILPAGCESCLEFSRSCFWITPPSLCIRTMSWILPAVSESCLEFSTIWFWTMSRIHSQLVQNHVSNSLPAGVNHVSNPPSWFWVMSRILSTGSESCLESSLSWFWIMYRILPADSESYDSLTPCVYRSWVSPRLTPIGYWSQVVTVKDS